VRSGEWPTDAQPWQSWTSPALAEVVRDINKFSNNVMARQLFLTLGGAGTDVTQPLSVTRARESLAHSVREATVSPDAAPACGAMQLQLDNGAGPVAHGGQHGPVPGSSGCRRCGPAPPCPTWWPPCRLSWCGTAPRDAGKAPPGTRASKPAHWPGCDGRGGLCGRHQRPNAMWWSACIQHPDAHLQARPVLDALLSWARQDQ
jgi:D-alanyl-D-alanine carboxypeptidase/D-alanyl-D-alanine-endopeptidase (penicillin-binding protein 4)